MVLEGYRKKLLQFTAIAKRDVFRRVIYSEIKSSLSLCAPQLAHLHIMYALKSQQQGGRHTKTAVRSLALRKDNQVIRISKTMLKEAPCSACFTNQRLYTDVC